jgi:ABC-type nitrate/sulfonate/bicarbonate transport system substrate-binding protein
MQTIGLRATGAFAALLLGVAAIARPAPAADMTALKVGISEPVNTVLALWMAETGGFYAAQGLKVDIMNMSGGSRGAEALQAGRIDVMHVGLSSVVRLNRAGADLRLIGSLSNVIRFTFFSAPGVKTAAELKGGVVGVSSFGSESDATVTLALQRLSLTRADVTLKEYGGALRRLELLKSGEIRATAINEPVSSMAREQGVRVLVDLAAENIPWLFSGVVVRRADLVARRAELTRFVKATIEGGYAALADEAAAKAVLARETKVSDPLVLAIGYEDFRKQLPATGEPVRAGADNVIAQLKSAGVTLNSTNPDDYVDTSILDDLKKQGVFAALEKKYGKR